MDEYLIQGETLTAIAQAIRDKTGSTDPIMTKDMASEISRISGGGGSESPPVLEELTVTENGTYIPSEGIDGYSSVTVNVANNGGGSIEGVCYVTFMSEDGSTEIYKKPCFVGDDCMNPLSKGWLEKQTKEPTNTEVFTQNGWSLTSGGSADDSALLNVTEDRTVYASFKASTRYYTVRFYDEGTLLESVKVAYGVVPSMSFTPEKTDYALIGWTPELTAVTGNANYTAVWESTISVIASGDCGESAKWMLDSKGVLKIYGSGDMYNYTYSYDSYDTDNTATYSTAPWSVYKFQISSVVILSGITSIGRTAFYKVQMSSIDIPETVTFIEGDAFRRCPNLTNIRIPDSVTFVGNSCFSQSSISSITLPINLESIPDSAFYSCRSLSEFVIPASVSYIGKYAFGSCTGLKSITIPANVKTICTKAFSSSGLTSAVFENTEGWRYFDTLDGNVLGSIPSDQLARTNIAASYLCSSYADKYWKR